LFSADCTYFLQLPHRTGSTSHYFTRDEVVVLTRSTLVGISTSYIGVVIDTLVHLLEDLSRPYKGIQTHPIHVLHSELYILELLAESCSTHWADVNIIQGTSNGDDGQSSDSEGSDSEKGSKNSTPPRRHGQKRRASRNTLLARDTPPKPLPDDLVRRLLDAVKVFSKPVPENYVLPASNILDDAFEFKTRKSLGQEHVSSTNGHLGDIDVSKLLLDKTDAVDAHVRGIIEYVSFSNWPRVLEYLRNGLLYAARPAAGSAVQTNLVPEDERSALITVKFISTFWVDSRKLGIVIQELCGSFLHLRKSFQTTVAIVVPLLISRWLERNPDEFIDLHSLHKRLDGGMHNFSLGVMIILIYTWKDYAFKRARDFRIYLPRIFAFHSSQYCRVVPLPLYCHPQIINDSQADPVQEQKHFLT
jgi:neurofibromin 1